MSFIDDDLSFVYSAMNPLAVACTLTTSGGASSVYVHFDEEYTPTNPLQAVNMANTTPSFTIPAAIYSTRGSSDTAAIGGTTYKVRRVEKIEDGKLCRVFLGS